MTILVEHTVQIRNDTLKAVHARDIANTGIPDDTDYVAETAEAMLEGPSYQPIPLMQDAIMRRGYVVPIGSLDDLKPFVGMDCHLRLSRITGTWFLYVIGPEA